MILLWTDTLILLLLLTSIAIGFYLHDKEHIQRPLNKIAHSKVGMVSLVVLLFFLLVGLLDSIHFKSNQESSNEIISLLDYCATPLREHNEKTYSAPFATTLYSKEMVAKDGSMQWDYPRLVYGGKHLENPEQEQLPDILLKVGIGFGFGLALFVLLILVSAGVSYLKHGSAPQFFAMRPVMVTLFVIFVLSSTLGYLSLYYHVLGTDKVGEDVFYQAIKSILHHIGKQISRQHQGKHEYEGGGQ